MKLKTEYITEHNRFWSEINNLAKEAFPPEEYLAPIELVRMSKANNFDFLLLTDDEQFVGFMVVQTHKKLDMLRLLLCCIFLYQPCEDAFIVPKNGLNLTDTFASLINVFSQK